jgi:predicted N-acetyltransferase YhbS
LPFGPRIQTTAAEYVLAALFVEPRYIGQGVGRSLIEHAKIDARKDRARSLLVQGDPNATNFYRAAGGVQIGERESASIPGRYLPEFRIPLEAEDVV